MGTDARRGHRRVWLCSSLHHHGTAPDRSADRPPSPVASTRDTGAIHPWDPPTAAVGECAVVIAHEGGRAGKTENAETGSPRMREGPWSLAVEKGREGQGGRMGATLTAAVAYTINRKTPSPACAHPPAPVIEMREELPR